MQPRYLVAQVKWGPGSLRAWKLPRKGMNKNVRRSR